MKTLYDLLGARPDDDAESLKNAFRRAAKANHPDLHADDPAASARFRLIASAYDVLRDTERRAAYDRFLRLEHARFRWISSGIGSYTIRKMAFDAIAVAAIAVVLAGGYGLFAHNSMPSVEPIKVVEETMRGPGVVAATPPAVPTDTTAPKTPRDKLVRMDIPKLPAALTAFAPDPNGGGAPRTANDVPALGPAGRDIEIAKIMNAFSILVDRTDVTMTANVPKENFRIEAPDSHNLRSVGVRVSPDFAVSAEKDDMKIPGKSGVAARRADASHASLTGASLENKSTSACPGSQSCPGHGPPVSLFGVRF